MTSHIKKQVQAMFSSTTHGIEAQSDAACVERAMKRKRDVATSQQMTARATERKRERERRLAI